MNYVLSYPLCCQGQATMNLKLSPALFIFIRFHRPTGIIDIQPIGRYYSNEQIKTTDSF